jgi:hypothetical protein
MQAFMSVYLTEHLSNIKQSLRMVRSVSYYFAVFSSKVSKACHVWIYLILG